MLSGAVLLILLLIVMMVAFQIHAVSGARCAAQFGAIALPLLGRFL